MAVLNSLTANNLSVVGKIRHSKTYYRHNITYYIDDDSTGGGYRSCLYFYTSIITTNSNTMSLSDFRSYLQKYYYQAPLTGSIDYNSYYGAGSIYWGVDGWYQDYTIMVSATQVGLGEASAPSWMGNESFSDTVVSA